MLNVVDREVVVEARAFLGEAGASTSLGKLTLPSMTGHTTVKRVSEEGG